MHSIHWVAICLSASFSFQRAHFAATPNRIDSSFTIQLYLRIGFFRHFGLDTGTAVDPFTRHRQLRGRTDVGLDASIYQSFSWSHNSFVTLTPLFCISLLVRNDPLFLLVPFSSFLLIRVGSRLIRAACGGFLLLITYHHLVHTLRIEQGWTLHWLLAGLVHSCFGER
ncbi:hypothetical protein BJ508DRAFT_131302 [Ascobolus immersus RN42]|uniref:Uncharacterized protein n=1 Tax=Ascobolus immersus RN42 TaxID=1160509 RepID=A0A3N4I245_ASCIM|nr:hypothetical protein BJ508DRAFT_131302 [Ascobolus immersus RN42]